MKNFQTYVFICSVSKILSDLTGFCFSVDNFSQYTLFHRCHTILDLTGTHTFHMFNTINRIVVQFVVFVCCKTPLCIKVSNIRRSQQLPLKQNILTQILVLGHRLGFNRHLTEIRGGIDAFTTTSYRQTTILPRAGSPGVNRLPTVESLQLILQ